MPVFNVYSAESGELLWSFDFEELNLPKISTELYEGRIRFNYSRNEDFNDFFYEPIPLEGESILLQLHRSFVEENVQGHDISYIIDSKSGTGHYVSDDIPHIITYKTPHFAIRDLYSDYFPVAIMRVEN